MLEGNEGEKKLNYDGFSYCGIHCSKYNVEYIPDAKGRWFQSPAFDVSQKDVSGRDGGYYYGNDAKIRELTLLCYFEEITKETREQIRNWLDRRTKGKLIFDERPFVYYNVRPTKVVTGEIYAVLTKHGEVYSGTFTITFAAYEPYGFLMPCTLTDEAEMQGAGMITGLLPSAEMPAAPTTQNASSFLLYNGGTQTCDTVIQIGGTGTNILIANAANGTSCSLHSLPTEGYLEIDSHLGKVTWVHGTHDSERDIFFEYHNEGYVTLAPYLPREFHVDASYTTGSNVVTFYVFVPTEDSAVGKYIFLDGAWHKIVSVSTEDNSVEIEDTMTDSGNEVTKLVTMNEITITGTLLQLNKLAIDYSPMIV